MARPRRSEPIRQRLLEAGADMLVEQGYHGTGIKEVLDRVGVPKGSFYNYFDSKEDFGAAVIRHFSDQWNQVLDAGLKPDDPDALRGLKKLLGKEARAFQERGFAGGCLLGNLGGELEGSERCREALAEGMRGWRDRIESALSRAQEQGTVRTDVSSRELADLFFDAWEGAVIRMKVDRSVRPLRRCLKHLLDGYFRPE